jgi:ribosomal protein S27AE
MIDKKQTNEKCPECGRGILMEQYWGSHQKRLTCSNPECPHSEFITEVL